jgi:tRNA (cmo5U34)-methyltransferase
MGVNLWTSSEHALEYPSRADSIPHRVEGQFTLWEFIPGTVRRILDLGTGDGRLLALVKLDHPDAAEVAVDFSPAMLEAGRKRFAGDSSLAIVPHNLDDPLPALGNFDAVVCSFAIHHLTHERKRALYAEIYHLLNQAGVFCNLEHVASPTLELHEQFSAYAGIQVGDRGPVEQAAGCGNPTGMVARYWLCRCGLPLDMGRELALLTGVRR